MERATTLPLVNGHVGRTVTYSRYTSSYCFGDSRGSGERDNQRVVLRCDGTYTMTTDIVTSSFRATPA